MRSIVLTLVPLSLLGACQSGQYRAVSPFEKANHVTALPAAEDPNGWSGTTPDTQGTLYGFDGHPVGQGPIGGPTPGTVQETEGTMPRGLEETGGSRLVVLELYAEAVRDRDALALEVDAQNTALEQAERRQRDLEARMEELQQAYDALGAQKEALEQEKLDLAARLTTAQIRRLQAEKAWLESAIEWRDLSERTAGAVEGASAAASEPPSPR